MRQLNDNIRLRDATKSDAEILTALINFAGEGLPVYLWSRMAGPGQSPWDVGRARAVRETGSFSYRHATMIDFGDYAAGTLIGYPIGTAPEPIGDDMPPIVVPLQELENLALGTWYVNVLAVLPGFREIGLGSKLLERAEDTAYYFGHHGLSIIVSSANEGARRLYARHGYRETARRTMVKDGWRHPGVDWILLLKTL